MSYFFSVSFCNYHFFPIFEHELKQTINMANKRKLKRTINYVAAVLTMHSDFVCRVSHPEPGMTAKVYYKKLIADFRKHVEELTDQVANIG